MYTEAWTGQSKNKSGDTQAHQRAASSTHSWCPPVHTYPLILICTHASVSQALRRAGLVRASAGEKASRPRTQALREPPTTGPSYSLCTVPTPAPRLKWSCSTRRRWERCPRLSGSLRGVPLSPAELVGRWMPGLLWGTVLPKSQSAGARSGEEAGQRPRCPAPQATDTGKQGSEPPMGELYGSQGA